MKPISRKAGKYILFLLAICVSATVYFANAYKILSVNRSTQPDILVVEGWIPESALKAASEEFTRGGYHYIVTTGFPYLDGIQVGSGGAIVFQTKDSLVPPMDSLYTISVNIRGTSCRGEYAHYNLFADSLEIGDRYTSRKKKSDTWQVKLSAPPDSLLIQFDNDAYNWYSDRDLFVYSVVINGREFPISNRVCIYRSYEGKYYFKRRLDKSTAEDAARYLTAWGIPDSLVIPVISTHIKRSKTYTSALDVRECLLKKHYNFRSFTIFTMGIHGRRSLLSFKKVFRHTASLGVISYTDSEITSGDWFKSLLGWKRIISETAGVLFISFIF